MFARRKVSKKVGLLSIDFCGLEKLAWGRDDLVDAVALIAKVEEEGVDRASSVIRAWSWQRS